MSFNMTLYPNQGGRVVTQGAADGFDADVGGEHVVLLLVCCPYIYSSPYNNVVKRFLSVLECSHGKQTQTPARCAAERESRL